VTVLQETEVGVNSVWAQVEYRAFIENVNVTSITAAFTNRQLDPLWSRP
jgi:hypothetical protein